jgi:hypothetical protein
MESEKWEKVSVSQHRTPESEESLVYLVLRTGGECGFVVIVNIHVSPLARVMCVLFGSPDLLCVDLFLLTKQACDPSSSPSIPTNPSSYFISKKMADSSDPDLVIAQYQTTRVRSLLANYQRLLLHSLLDITISLTNL